MIRMLCCFLSREEKDPRDLKKSEKGKKDGSLAVLKSSKRRSGKKKSKAGDGFGGFG